MRHAPDWSLNGREKVVEKNGPSCSLAATSNSSTCGRVKLPNPRWRDGGLYSTVVRFATRAAASFSRQLLPSNFSRWPWCREDMWAGFVDTDTRVRYLFYDPPPADSDPLQPRLARSVHHLK